MSIQRLLVLASLTHRRLVALLRQLPADARRGRPWSCSRRRRVLIACVALRTNLTVRELAALCALSKSAAHRIVATIRLGWPPSNTTTLAAIAANHGLSMAR